MGYNLLPNGCVFKDNRMGDKRQQQARSCDKEGTKGGVSGGKPTDTATVMAYTVQLHTMQTYTTFVTACLNQQMLSLPECRVYLSSTKTDVKQIWF